MTATVATIHALNLLLAASALVAGWRRRLYGLRAFLVYALLFDICSLLVRFLHPPDAYDFTLWYFYWAGRSVGFALQLALLVEALLRGASAQLRLFNAAWSIAAAALFSVITWKTWVVASSVFTDAHMLRYSLMAAALCGMLSLVALLLRNRYRIALAGSALLAVVTIVCCAQVSAYVHATWYPLASILPLLAWNANFMNRRTKWNDVSAEALQRDRADKRRHAAENDESGNAARILHEQRQGAGSAA